MRYPSLTLSKTKDITDGLREDSGEPDWETVVDWVGSGRDVDLDALVEVIERMRTEYEHETELPTSRKAEVFEGRFAGAVHKALRDLPIEILDDPGFWRYLSLRHFWWFIAEREAGSIAHGNVMTYVDGERECVPFRMFLRAQAIRRGDDYELASALLGATDFWRSHILRVRTGMTPPLARSFARLQADTQMPTTTVRPIARKLNRLWSNIVFDLWTEDECGRLLRGLHEDETSPGAGVPPA